ncbi:hypothetical protein AB1Y20_000024 [Prymnesium parvum]|uniref:Alpha-mannosidase n=1 Tax=Prymnesium parvum TaxID=97485 RepID=A0AB34K7S9_PRYPA
MQRTALAALLLTGVHANGRHDLSGNVIAGLAPEELAVTQSGHLGDRTPSIEYWALKDKRSRGAPPYPFPPDRVYNTNAGPVEGKINVHLVPHSHDDTGWQVTVDQYFATQVYFIIDTVIQNLAADENRKFIYVETGFFARWWEQASDTKRALAKKVVKSKQLEFINGGWCMHDEASPLWTAMVDQTTRGHQFILKNFGVEASPRGTWQIDPFGHSNTEAWLLGEQAGFESIFWGRMDWQDRTMRYNKNEGFEWIWQGSESLGESAQIFAGDLFGTGGGGYSTWIDFDGSGDQVIDDPARHDWNVDQWVDKFVQDALDQRSHSLSDHQMWACGTDFQYQNADHWYRNLDKLIHYVNLNGTVNAFYSTPSIYTDWKKKWNGSYQVRTDDIFPLGDNPHNYWSGYFTSRPALKRQVRFATNLLMSARQLEVVTNTTAAEVNMPTVKRSPVVGTSWTDSLEGTVGVATHHDGMSGTERQDVTDDYEQRISESSFEVEAGLSLAFSKLLGVPADTIAHCNCNVGADCLNMTVCAASTGKTSFTVAAWNPMAHALSEIARVPVTGSQWVVTDAQGNVVPSQVVAIDERTKSLPLLYLNSYNMDAAQIAAARKELANEADHVLIFNMPLPPVGLNVFLAKASAAPNAPRAQVARRLVEQGDDPIDVSSSTYQLTFDSATGMLSRITNKKTGAATDLSISWGWYNSSVGGCTTYDASVPPSIQSPPCSDQKPNSSTVFFPGPTVKPTIEVVRGDLVTEVHQTFSSWASHVIRLYEGKNYVEVEWTAGPIPVDTPWMAPVAYANGEPLPNNWGKEVIVKYSSGLKSQGVWYTDSNGKEMLRRVYNKRGPSYPSPYNISEPVAGNYYPVNALMALDDGVHELTVLTDVSQAGASLRDGELEFMVHRRLQDDDSRGVQEPLNETMCGCNDIGAAPGQMGAHGHEGDGGCACAGLTVRGRHWIVFDTIDNAHAARRILSEQLNFPPLLAFSSATPRKLPPSSALSAPLPPAVKLVTLTSNYASFNDGQLLLRLSHLYQAGEHPTLAVPVEVDLQQVFGAANLTITSAVETTLTGNRKLSDWEKAKHKWNSHAANARVQAHLNEVSKVATVDRKPFSFPKVTIRPMEVRTFLANFH